MCILMEAGRNFLASSPPIPSRTHLRNCSSSASVLMLHEQLACALPCMRTTSLAQHLQTSVLLQELRNECRTLSHITKEDKTSQVTFYRRSGESESSAYEEDNNKDSSQRCTLNLPGLWYILPSLQDENVTSLKLKSVLSEGKNFMDFEPRNMVSLAKKALSASKQAAFLAEVDESFSPSSRFTCFTSYPHGEKKTVRSTRLLERRSNRRVPRAILAFEETSNLGKPDLQRKTTESYYQNDPFRLLLQRRGTRRLLTMKEEYQLIAQIQIHRRLEKVKSKLQSLLDREPTMVEWAAVVRLSCGDLKLQIHRAKRSRERLIYANFRLVVSVAKQYQGRDLSLQDLLQAGSIGLMRSVDKFKPEFNCRFSTYAYIGIRRAIDRAIFNASRLIRLPSNVYGILDKVSEARRLLCMREVNREPTLEETAACVGITVERLREVLLAARRTLSLHKGGVYLDSDTTFEDITPDPEACMCEGCDLLCDWFQCPERSCTILDITPDPDTETPDVIVTKQFMRQAVWNLLNVLTPREQKIIRLRYGIDGRYPETLSEIGDGLGLCRERIRQLESRAMDKLKQVADSRGLDVYIKFLV